MSETVESAVKHESANLNSNDPEERKLARRLRIERRANLHNAVSTTSVLRVLSGFTGDTGKNEQENIKIKKQKLVSEKSLREKIATTNLLINTIIPDIDEREVNKRKREGVRNEEIIQEFEEKARKAQNAFEEIATKWSLIKRSKDPYHIQESLKLQKENCTALILKKDEIISRLKNLIVKSEKEFLSEQRKQLKDISKLTGEIEKQLELIKNAYDHEYNIIAHLVRNMKVRYVDDSYNKWLEFHAEERVKEEKHSEEQFRQLQYFHEKMNLIRIDFYEKFRDRNCQLKSCIYTSRQQLEVLRSLALINGEKLDYNFQILKRREDENIFVKGQQKRRINKLQDIITSLKRKLIDYKTTTKNQIIKKNEMIKKMQRSILDVESKADQFSATNDKKFHQLWELNKKRCAEIVKKIVATDKILHEQLMAVYWNPPNEISLTKETMPSFKAAVNLLKKKQTAEEAVKLENEAKICKQSNYNFMYRRLLKHIFMILSDKSGFLTEKRLKSLINHYEDEQMTIVTLENVFNSLNITDKEFLDIIVQYFLPYCYCNICVNMITPDVSVVGSQLSTTMSHSVSVSKVGGLSVHNADMISLHDAVRMTQEPKNIIESAIVQLISDTNLYRVPSESEFSLNLSEEDNTSRSSLRRRSQASRKRMLYLKDLKDMTCALQHPLVISCIYVIRALREFVESYHKEIKSVPTTGERIENRRLTISRLLSNDDITAFWKKVQNYYSEERYKVWDALLSGLNYYHEVLKQRQLLAKEVCELRKVNESLKNRLKRYQKQNILLPPICNQSYLR